MGREEARPNRKRQNAFANLGGHSMRYRRQHAGLTVNGIAGTHVVFFGLDLAETKLAGFRGFGFKRFDHVEGDTIWLQGLKTFQKTEPYPATGERFSTLHHPIQSFQWADYSAKPGTSYTYTVVALYGDPASLETRIELEFDITTEPETGSVHSAFFNRGSVATQEYARRFQNQPPNEAGPGAYQWLSRGLLEALVAFLGRAGKGWEVHGAVYEFQWPEALAAVRQAHLRGAKVTVLYDDITAYDRGGDPDGPFQKNRNAIDEPDRKRNLRPLERRAHRRGRLDRAGVPRLLGPARGRPSSRRELPERERCGEPGAAEAVEGRHDSGLLAARHGPGRAPVVCGPRRRREGRPIHDFRLWNA